jgi:hypothetical protein
MTKFLVFKNNRESGMSNIPGSPEDLACEIACFVEGDDNSKTAVIAFPSETPEATFATLKLVPRFILSLDTFRMNVWLREAKPLIRKIASVREIFENAHADLNGAMEDLALKIQFCPSFKHISLTTEVNVDFGFHEMGSVSQHNFAHYVSDYFEVRSMDYFSARSG